MDHNLLLLIAGVIGGVINSIAGGGGIIMYPVLLLGGLAPIVANATSSLVVLPGSITSAYGYRKELYKVPRIYLWLVIPCLIGSFIGATILVNTNPNTFENLAPWLVLSAVMLLATQSRLHRWLTTQTKKRKIRWHTMPLIYLSIFPLAIYGGFFGVGAGLMILVILGFTQLNGTHQLNGIKNICGIAMTLVAAIYFAHAGLINYSSGLIMAIGTSIGGLTGAKMAHKVSAHTVHDFTVLIGFIIAIILIIKAR